MRFSSLPALPRLALLCFVLPCPILDACVSSAWLWAWVSQTRHRRHILAIVAFLTGQDPVLSRGSEGLRSDSSLTRTNKNELDLRCPGTARW